MYIDRTLARSLTRNKGYASLTWSQRLSIAAQLDAGGYKKEADRFVNCGKRVHIFQSSGNNELYGILESCRSRICPRCSELFYRKYLRELKLIIKGLNTSGKKRISFITLTFKKPLDQDGNPIPLTRTYIRACIKNLRVFMNCFFGKYSQTWDREKLKIRKSKKYIGCGAFAVLEIGKGGNLHFHALVYGYYRPLKLMSEVWKYLTTDSYRIQIDQVGHKTQQTAFLAAKYILKYIQKPPPFKNVRSLVAYGLSLKGIRRIHTYGIFWGDPRLRDEKKPFVCPVTGLPLRYAGTAYDGQVVLRYSAISAELDKIVRIDALIMHLKEDLLWDNREKIFPESDRGEGMRLSVQDFAYYADRCTSIKKRGYNPNIYCRKEIAESYVPKRKKYFYKSHNFDIDNLAAFV